MKRHACLVPYGDLLILLGDEQDPASEPVKKTTSESEKGLKKGREEQTKDIVTVNNLNSIIFRVRH